MLSSLETGFPETRAARKESGTSTMRPATPSTGPKHACFGGEAPGLPLHRRTESIARCDWPLTKVVQASFGFVLSRKLAQRLFRFFNVIQRQLSRFDQPRHNGFARAAKQGE